MLSENNQKQLELIVREHQFEHVMDYLKESVRQGIRLSKKEIENYKDICSSRIGGDPDLLPSVEWPLDSNGTPMTFLAQLRLHELAPHDVSSLLPAGGMLYFFVGVDEPAYHIEHKVLYLQEEKLQEAQRRPSPEVTALEEEFTGYRVTARATIEPPNYGYVDDEQVEDGEHDYEEYEDLCFELTGYNSSDLAVLFGYPATQHGDCEYKAALRLLTGKEYNYSVKTAMEQITAHLNGDSDKAEREVRDTLLLLALDSDQEVGFCWWDAGELQFYIRKEDLLAGKFEHTYCSLYSS
ncbi:YwqG family protein [Paenibacillus marinisediminis]